MGSVQGNGIRVVKVYSDPTAFLTWCCPLTMTAEDAAHMLILQIRPSGLVDAAGGSTSSMGINTPAPRPWLGTFQGSCFMLLAELPGTWLNDILFVGSLTHLYFVLTSRKFSLPLPSRVVTPVSPLRVCFRAVQETSGNAFAACFCQGRMPMSRSLIVTGIVVETGEIIHQCVWNCVFFKLKK